MLMVCARTARAKSSQQGREDVFAPLLAAPPRALAQARGRDPRRRRPLQPEARAVRSGRLRTIHGKRRPEGKLLRIRTW